MSCKYRGVRRRRLENGLQRSGIPPEESGYGLGLMIQQKTLHTLMIMLHLRGPLAFTNFSNEETRTPSPSLSSDSASAYCIWEESSGGYCFAASSSTYVQLVGTPDSIFYDDSYFLEEFGHIFEMDDCGILATELNMDSLDLPDEANDLLSFCYPGVWMTV